ncbi:DUF1120 domain-containing protein [Enterobacter mori]|uniref:DUF1120 domain-containing protein n=1 Tax=Enterobacter mori TaxID=539813 RepID=UPI001B8C7FED|nr:DUF1120 domain-containing protein [Enterobacter mori]MBS3046406.1 DUF1120 domain-containing protein [Enterobacter mori]
MLRNKLFTPLLLAVSCGLVIGQASAATVALTGTIEPTTCSLTLGTAAVHDFAYGDISPASLNNTAMTALAVKTVPLKVTCDAPTRVAIGAVDNKMGSNPFASGTVNMSAAGGATDGNAADMLGLGNDGTGKIGAYSLALVPASMKIDGAVATPVRLFGGTGTWAATTNGFIGGATQPGYWRSWATGGAAAPLAGTTFEADLAVQPWVNAKSKLDLTHDILLNGAATIELHYL